MYHLPPGGGGGEGGGDGMENFGKNHMAFRRNWRGISCCQQL